MHNLNRILEGLFDKDICNEKMKLKNTFSNVNIFYY